MAAKCAREECGKTVYPIEELKCLDKVWHKLCFKCSSCGMTLNMKNYKGYDKKPYCEAHYPKTVASVVTDTPEMLRLAQNTKLQSQIKYHEDYEKMKGTKTSIADDPELTRHLQNTKVQSQVQYHGELEKKLAQESNRPKEELTNNAPTTFSSSYAAPSGDENMYTAKDTLPAYGNAQTANAQDSSSPYSQRLANQGTVVYSSENGGRVPAEQRQVGSIADYDPLNGDWGTAGKASEKTATTQRQQSTELSQSAQQQKQGGQQKTKASTTTSTSSNPAPAASRAPTGFTVKALYDYTAADKDEVSFKENDIIVNCANVDEGWMTGTVQRTLTWGMLPANYVERINQPTGLFKLN